MEQSFCAIGEFPYKTLNNMKFLEMVKNHFFSPIHAIIIPTNRCNLSCDFCCCADRKQTEELSMEDIRYILDNLSKYGVDAITLSGGGEPTIHSDFIKIISTIKSYNMRIGLVTNGIKISSLKNLSKGSFEWCRVSFGDGRDRNEVMKITEQSKEIFARGITRVLGISYVLTKNPDMQLIADLGRIIDNCGISYLKFIIDESICEEIDYPLLIKELPCVKKIITPIVFRKMHNTECMLNLIKPIFAADRNVYPCCEIQYNNEDKTLCYSKSRMIGSFSEYFQSISQQRGMKITTCHKCFHSTLVEYMASTKRTFIHGDWI